MLTFIVFIGCNSTLSLNDLEPPEVNIIYPKIDSKIITGTNVKIQTEVSDNIQVNYIDIFINDQIIASISNTPYEHNWDTTDLYGKQLLNIRAYDSNDNETISEIIEVNLLTPDDIEPELILVNGGSFQMGDIHDEGEENEFPVHSVELSPYYIGKYEITNSQVVSVFNWGISKNLVSTESNNFTVPEVLHTELIVLYGEKECIKFDGSQLIVDEGKNDFPCNVLTWYGSAYYCNLLSIISEIIPAFETTGILFPNWQCDFSTSGYRLPTEAEWEFAARGGESWTDSLKYSGCNRTSNLRDYGWISINSNDKIHNIGMLLPNQLGIYDMTGNVLEACWGKVDTGNNNYFQDCFDQGIVTNPTGSNNTTLHILRGGSWDSDSYYARTAYRSFVSSIYSTGLGITGVRIVKPVN